jgi:hypothetical protein
VKGAGSPVFYGCYMSGKKEFGVKCDLRLIQVGLLAKMGAPSTSDFVCHCHSTSTAFSLIRVSPKLTHNFSSRQCC